MRGHGSQWFSHKMNNRHPLQLKKSKSWESCWSYQLNSTTNFEVNGLDWIGAENLSYVKLIETHALAFLTLNILSIGTVFEDSL